MSCVWAKIETPSVNLKEIITEQLHTNVKKDELKNKSNSEDEIIARMLQIQCDNDVESNENRNFEWEDVTERKNSLKVELLDEEFTPASVSVVVKKKNAKSVKPSIDSYEMQSAVISKIIANCIIQEYYTRKDIKYEDLFIDLVKLKEEFRKAIKNRMIVDKRWVSKIKEMFNLHKEVLHYYLKRDGRAWLQSHFWNSDIKKSSC